MFSRPMRRLLCALLALTACDDASGPSATVDAEVGDVAVDQTLVDAAPADAIVIDAAPMDAEIDPADAATDAGPDAMPDAGPVVCSAPPPTPSQPTGALPARLSTHAGVDAWEAEAWGRLRTAARADPAVHFIATFDHAADALVIEAADARIEAQRVDGRWTVTAGELAAVFPSTAQDRYGSLDDLFAAFEPYPSPREMLGYAADDVRVGGLTLGGNSWPDPLERLGTLFDSANAPDGLIGLWPWARGGNGTHGGLGLLQSRSTLVLAGKGARPGLIDTSASLVDVAPTVLAALGAPTTDGVGPDGTYADGLYLRWQDGRVLWEALSEDPCDRPRHVVVVLFDGLMANELTHQVLSPTPDIMLPTLRALAGGGAIYRYGAVAGFPSMSAPGHMTIGTGAWPGHHGILNNYFYDRAEQARVEPLAFASDPAGFAMDPAAAFAFHDVYVPDNVETLAAAAHRAFGAWDPDARTGAYVAVINDIPVGDADFTTADYLTGARSKGLRELELADELATIQATTLLGTPAAPVPTILQVGYGATDSAGETHGPHAPLTRGVLEALDGDMGRIIAAYDRAGALDDTLFVLVSDHGMELQDPSRAGGFRQVLAAGDVRTSEASFGVVYLRTLELESRPIAGGFEVVIRNHDNQAPVAGVALTCPTCLPAETDADGRAVVASLDGLVGLHPEFNPLYALD